jgi:hypothetical protein
MHADCICFETYGENRERWEVVDDWKDRRPRGMQAAAYLRDPCLFGSALAVLLILATGTWQDANSSC